MWGILGQIIYVIGYPVLLLLLKGSNRAYVVIIHKDKVLVTKNWLGYRRKWRLPGGGSRNGENYIQTAIREVLEEVGIDLRDANIQSLGPPVRHKMGFEYQTYVTELLEVPIITKEFPEIWRAEFVDIKLLNDLEKNLQLRNALLKLGKNS